MSASGPAIVAAFPGAFERLGHALTRLGFGLAVLLNFAAPVLALSWRNTAFPGFFVEQTLVINQTQIEGWAGSLAGMAVGQRLVRIGGIPVNTVGEYQSALSSFNPGQQVAVFTVQPDGMGRLYPGVTLGTLSNTDFFRLFWLPYLVGLVYLGIGVWIYLARGKTYSGMALAVFCVLTSGNCAMIFDFSTTHQLTLAGVAALGMSGAALVNLGMVFPQEWAPLRRRLWLLSFPYGISAALIAWMWAVVNDNSRPWVYQDAMIAMDRFLAFGIAFFIGVVMVQAVRNPAALVRRQARIVLLGTLLAAAPLTAWLVAPIFGLSIPFDVSLLFPPLILFAVSIAVAILRYRLLEIDALVHRTIVYGLLTAILAGLFTALVGLSQKLFIALTGEKSDAAIVITTLIVASAFTPVRARLQALVDRQFKEKPDHTRALQAFGEQVSSFVEMSSAPQLARRLLDEAGTALNAAGGALALLDGDPTRPRIVHTFRQWKGEALIHLPVECDGRRYGYLMLGPRADGSAYTRREAQVVQQVTRQIASAMRLDTMDSTQAANITTKTKKSRSPSADHAK